jgi:tetratricopeptide (TPR) repeat protein
MERIEKTVFISYRRINFPWALAIYKDLTQHGYDVFIDYQGIASGDFERAIFENIKAKAHFLVLLTPSSLERCGEPADLFRREIETALANQRNIVPVVLEGFDFGSPTVASHLTGTLAALRLYNELRIPMDYFEEALERLRKFLSVPLTAVLHPASLDAQVVAAEQKTAADAAPAVQEEELTAQQWFELGFAASDLAEKVRLYSEAVRLKPDFAEAFANRGLVRRYKGDVEGAMQDLNVAIRLKPNLVETFYNRGNLRRDKGDVEGAMQDLNELIRLKPDYAAAFYSRGNLRRDKGDVEGALQDFNEAVRLTPDYAEAFVNRGSARLPKDAEGALQDYDQAIRAKPDLAEAFYGRGLVRSDKGDVEGALQDFNEAARLKPGYAETFYERGNLRRDKGDMEGALQDFSEAARLKADYAEAFTNRGLVRHAQGDMEGALQDYNQAIRANPDLANALHGRGIIRRRKGDLVGALQDFRAAIRLEPDIQIKPRWVRWALKARLL